MSRRIRPRIAVSATATTTARRQARARPGQLRRGNTCGRTPRVGFAMECTRGAPDVRPALAGVGSSGLACPFGRMSRRTREGAAMAATRTLFIGGTGVISSACVGGGAGPGPRGHGREPRQQLDPSAARRCGGAARRHPRSGERPPGARRAQLRRRGGVPRLHARARADGLRLFEGRVGQFVFISSASAYQKPPSRGAGHRVHRRSATRSGSTPATRSPARTC